MKDDTLNPTVVGIDIGTFTTKISAVQRGVVEAVINEANFRETPSVVGFGQGQRKIGQLGSVKLKSNFKNTVVSPTRYLGLNVWNQSVAAQLANCPCPTKFEGDELHFKVNFNGVDQSFTTEQILAAFMTKISSIINHNNLDPRMIVFSVPSCLTQSQKKSILNAAEISGMKNVRLATQAICIGLDYGSYKKSDMGQGKYVVFVDFGYYQLSLSLIKFTPTTMEVITERSNRNLGCRDIDQKVFDYIAKKFEQKKGLNIKQSKRACLKLLEAIQKQRKILSGIAQTDISIQCLFQDQDLSQPFTRQIMISQAGETFKQIGNLLNDFKEQVQKRNIKIDSVQLIGGGSRIPKFIELVQQAFKMSPSRTTNSSQTISRGATLAAVQFSGLFRFDTFSIINKSLNGIVLSWRDLQSNEAQFPALNNQTIIQTNEVIPCEKTLKIQANKNIQILISYDILDSSVEKKIAKITFQNTELNKTTLSLSFSINQDGFIRLTSVKDAQNRDVKYAINYFRQISPQKMLAYKAKQREMFVKDFSTLKLHQKRNQLQTFIYKQKQIINSQQFKKYLTPEQNQKAKQYLLEISQTIQSQDKQLGIKDYQKKKKQIQQQITKLYQSAKKKKLQIGEHFKQLERLKTYASDAMKQISQRFRKSKPVIQCFQAIKQIHEWAQQAIKVTKTKNVNQLPVVTKQDIQQQYQNIRTLVDQLVNPPQPKPQPRHQHFEEHYDPNQYMRRSWVGPQNFRNDDDDEEYQRQRQAKLMRQQQQKLQMQRQQQQLRQQQQRQRQRQRQQQYYQGFGYPQYYQPQSQQQQRARYAQEQQLLRRQQQQQQARRRQQQQRQYEPFGSRSGFFGPSSNNFFNGFF